MYVSDCFYMQQLIGIVYVEAGLYRTRLAGSHLQGLVKLHTNSRAILSYMYV